MFTVNGKELDYDIFDVDKADVYEKAMNTVFGKDGDPRKGKRQHVLRKSDPSPVRNGGGML